jgi:hypothetical protein
MARRQPKPSPPYKRLYDTKKHRVTYIWTVIQNIFRMWRDFPQLRIGQFIVNAVQDEVLRRADGLGDYSSEMQHFHTTLFYLEDDELELRCWRYWLRHSGKAGKRMKEKYGCSESTTT